MGWKQSVKRVLTSRSNHSVCGQNAVDCCVTAQVASQLSLLLLEPPYADSAL